MKTRFVLLLVWLFTALACLGQVNLIVAPSGTLTVRTNIAVPMGQIGLVDVTLTSSSATPEGAVTANPGSMHFRRDTGDWYRKVSGVGNTGWAVQGGGTTINATDGVMPYRLNATTFADSPLEVVGGETGDIIPRFGNALGNYGDEFSGVYSTFLSGIDIYAGDFALDRGIRTGVGDPNGVPQSPNAGGSIYLREDGPPWVYVKTTLSELTLTGWEAISTGTGAASDNWVASGTTNSTLAGTGLLYNLVATNDVTLGARLIFSPGETNILYRLDADLVYSNSIASSIGPYIQIWDGLGNAGKVGVSGNIIQLKTAGSAVGVELMDDSSRSVRWFGNGLVPTQSNSSLGSSVNPWQDIYPSRNIVWNGTTNTVWDKTGTGNPEGAVAAGVGSIYRRYDGGTGTTVYFKESGTGNTGWAAIGTGPAFSDLVWTNNAGVVQLVTQTNRIDLGDGTYSVPSGAHIGMGFNITDESPYGFFAKAKVTNATNAVSYSAFRFEAADSGTTLFADPWVMYVLGGSAVSNNTLINPFNYDDGSVGLTVENNPTIGSGTLLPGWSASIFAPSYSDQSIAFGIAAFSEATKNGQTNVAIAGRSTVNGLSGVVEVGGAFLLTTTSSNPVDYQSAALLADNGDTALPVFIARTNGVEVFSIDGTGVGTFAKNLTVPSLNTGQGENELYDMDQNVLTTSTPQFARLGLGAAADANAQLKASRSILDQIEDASNNEVLKFSATASAINELTVANAATTGNPVLSATGGDSNISITITPKGTGNVRGPSGTAAIPGFSFAGDPDTGMYNGAANQLYFSAAGTAIFKALSATLAWPSTVSLNWQSSTIDTTPDLTMVREAAAIIQFGNDSATVVNQTLKSHDGSGTDKNGASHTRSGGRSTGAGTGGSLINETSLTGSTGAGLNLYSIRSYRYAGEKTITESSASIVLNLALASSKYIGGRIMATTHATDATDFQAVTDSLTFSAVNKAGTVTTAVQAAPSTSTAAASTGTLTTTWTVVANGAGLDIKCNAVSSLTQTILQTKWQVELNSDDVATVTP